MTDKTKTTKPRKSKYPKMRRYKAPWLKALRSGQYKRGDQALCKIDEKGEKRYCCLGVLCDVIIKKDKTAGRWDAPALPGERSFTFVDQSGKENSGSLTDDIQKLVFRTVLPDGESGDPEIPLIRMNDSGKKSFKFIADWIEKNL